jgi:succinate-semialdehyde dehydrogenase/glutarate-semialdehyde dehydrogenase
MSGLNVGRFVSCQFGEAKLTDMVVSPQLKRPDLVHSEGYIHGKWVQPKSGKKFQVVDPGTDKPWAEVANFEAGDVDGAVQSAYEAFQTFKHVSPRVRAERLLKWDSLIRANKEDIAQLITLETGKPLAESRGEVEYATSFTAWFAGEAERIQGTTSRAAIDGRRIFTVKQPVGVVAALVPWNFPVAYVVSSLKGNI